MLLCCPCTGLTASLAFSVEVTANRVADFTRNPERKVILILHLKDSRDFFIDVEVSFQPSVFGQSLYDLVGLSSMSVEDVPPPTATRGRANAVRQCEPEKCNPAKSEASPPIATRGRANAVRQCEPKKEEHSGNPANSGACRSLSLGMNTGLSSPATSPMSVGVSCSWVAFYVALCLLLYIVLIQFLSGGL